MGAQVSRETLPPLPGGYKVGEQVYYTGCSHVFESGERVEHGQQGEVVGPALRDSHKGRGVAVRFLGINLATNCLLTEVRHHSIPWSNPRTKTLPLP